MSGIVKGIGKIFKKVFDVVKKVAAPLLAVAAIVFTGGAALGLPALAGGWGGAVTSGLSALGLNTAGPLGTILTGAATAAGKGAAIGGLTSLASGGDFAKGATTGALVGGATGGLMGGMRAMGGGPLAGTNMLANEMGKVTASPRGLMPGGLTSPGAPTAGPQIADATTIQNPGTGIVPTGATATTPGGGLLGQAMSSPVLGGIISGAGQGLMQGMAAKEEAEALEEEQDRRTSSYNLDPSAYDTAAADTTARPSPEQRWGRRNRVRYNPATGLIEGIA